MGVMAACETVVPYNTPFGIHAPHPRTTLRDRHSLQSWLDMNVLFLVLKGQIVDRISMATLVRFWSKSARLGVTDGSTIKDYLHTLENLHGALSHLGNTTFQNVAHLCRAAAGSAVWAPIPTRQEASYADISYAFSLWSYFRIFVYHIRKYYVMVSISALEHSTEPQQCDDMLRDLAIPFNEAGFGISEYSITSDPNPEEQRAGLELIRASTVH